jgi:hypothetical protein
LTGELFNQDKSEVGQEAEGGSADQLEFEDQGENDNSLPITLLLFF